MNSSDGISIQEEIKMTTLEIVIVSFVGGFIFRPYVDILLTLITNAKNAEKHDD